MSVLNRDAARKVLAETFGYVDRGPEKREAALDALEGCVRPVPQQTIDRDALLRVLHSSTYLPTTSAVADSILALSQPVDGVVLTREEAATAIYALRHIGDGTAWRTEKHRDLADRLEAAR